MPLPKQDLTYLFIVPGQDWSSKAISLALENKGLSLCDIEAELGVAGGTLRNVFYRRCKKYEEVIAQKIGLPPETIWPNRPRNDNRQSA